ncbi:hypothetical protein OEZ86_008972 [Tetradesmus obliquus]|nr:hypothetical protein OEZ86_008972 [Tetradesmus obliquus]
MLQLLPGLLSEGRGRLAARTASLATCIAKTAKLQQQVQELLQRRQQQQLGTAAAAAGSRVDAGAAAEVAVLSSLADRLQQLMSRWSDELEQQVLPALVQVLPTALLAAIELVYLGPLPATTQQQLLAHCSQLLTAATSYHRT